MPRRTDLNDVERQLPTLPPRPRRRGRAILWIASVVGAMVLFGGGWFAAAAVESPAQQEARATAPKAGPITAEVSKGALQQTVTSRATVQRASQDEVAVSASGNPSVVTATPVSAGQPVKAGTVVLEVNGQPVFAVPGKFAFYRDLTVGESGPDVKQLQEALDADGYRIVADGTFGAGTESAVEDLYRQAGYRAPMTDASTGSSPTGGSSSDSAGSGDAGSAAGSASSDANSKPAASAVGSASGSSTPSSVDSGASVSGESSSSSSAATPEVVDVPASAFLVASSLPAALVSAPPVGSEVGESSAINLESGNMDADAQIPPDTATELKTGMHTTLSGPDGKSIDALIGTVTQPTKDGENATVLINPSAELPSSWLHQSVLATITVQVAATGSLIVPTSAIITSGHGQADVLLEEASGAFAEVPVTEVASLSGKSAVTATSGALKPGDRVKVG